MATTANTTLKGAQLATAKKFGEKFVHAAKWGAPVEIAFAGYDQYQIAQRNEYNRKEQHGEAAVDAAVMVPASIAGGAAVSGVVLGTGIIASGGTLLLGIAAAGVASGVAYGVKSGIKYGLDFHSTEDARFQANLDTKTHMRGLASQRFREQMLDKNGQIDWKDSSKLEAYANFLQSEETRLKNEFNAKSGYTPRWLRQLWNANAVMAQEETRADLNIVLSAQTELKDHMEFLSYLKEQDAKLVEALKKLSADGKGNVTVNDLKRTQTDKDKLTQEDKKEIEKIVGSEIAPLLFNKLAAGGIDFNNQQIVQNPAALQQAVATPSAPSPHTQQAYRASKPKVAPVEPPKTIFAQFGDWFLSLFSWLWKKEEIKVANTNTASLQGNFPRSASTAIDIQPPSVLLGKQADAEIKI